MSITRLNYFTAKPDRVEQLKTFLSEVIDVVSKAEGCESCRLLRDQREPEVFVILETWSSIAAHQRAANVIPKEKIMSVLELVKERPSGDYFTRVTSP